MIRQRLFVLRVDDDPTAITINGLLTAGWVVAPGCGGSTPGGVVLVLQYETERVRPAHQLIEEIIPNVQYVELLQTAGYNTLGELACLTIRELADLGLPSFVVNMTAARLSKLNLPPMLPNLRDLFQQGLLDRLSRLGIDTTRALLVAYGTGPKAMLDRGFTRADVTRIRKQLEQAKILPVPEESP